MADPDQEQIMCPYTIYYLVRLERPVKHFTLQRAKALHGMHALHGSSASLCRYTVKKDTLKCDTALALQSQVSISTHSCSKE